LFWQVEGALTMVCKQLRAFASKHRLRHQCEAAELEVERLAHAKKEWTAMIFLWDK
jgi:hypothetical protein